MVNVGQRVMRFSPGYPAGMLTEIYIEALLVDEELADLVWEAWDAGEIDDLSTCSYWWLITVNAQQFGDYSTKVSK